MTRHFNVQVPRQVRSVVARISGRGGRAVLVGGAVLDIIQGREPKDWDLEVFKLSLADIESIFADLRPNMVGKSFGVVKISDGGVDLDLNVTRRDNKVGTGHKGFEVVCDPNMTVQEAARRRDFTINSMSLDLETGELIDPFNGFADLQAGVLRVTDPKTFVEDPLRALRAMQLLARKAKTVDPSTMNLIESMSGSFPELPRERVWEEFRKLVLKAPRPSVGLEFLRESGWLVHFPELQALIGCEQRAEWHPEGDVWTHSLMAVDAAAQIRDTVPEQFREALLFGALLHDFGKPDFTITQEMIDRRHPLALKVAEDARRPLQEMILTAHGHDKGGMDPAESFLRRMTDNTKLIKLVRGLVGLHMRPSTMLAGNAGKGAFVRLHREMVEAGGDLFLLGRVCQCDACATTGGRSLLGGAPNWEHATSERLFAAAEEIASQPASVTPKVQGRDLIALGMKPGTAFGRILKAALDLQDANAALTREEILAQVLPVAS